MSAKFTKGPWRIDDNYSAALMISAGSWPVCEVSCDICGNGYGIEIKPDATDSANAHLIKTSPKMYEVLEEIVSYAYANQLSKIDWDMIERAQDILEEARGGL